MSPALAVFDRFDLTLVSCYPLTSAADVHSVCELDGHLYVVSTGTDEVLQLQLSGHRVTAETVFWRPEPTAPRSDVHHLNGLCAFEGQLLVSGFGKKTGALWSDARNGFVCSMQRQLEIVSHIYHPHSIIHLGNMLAYCESKQRAVQVVDGPRIKDLPGYTRGLCADGRSLFVGTSVSRNVSKSTGATLKTDQIPARCAVTRVSLDDWTVGEIFDLSAYGNEIYDVVPVEGARNWPRADVQRGAASAQHSELSEAITTIIPLEARFLFINEAWRGIPDMLGDRQAIPFLEREGQYWGLPATDAVAIRELERLRTEGTAYIVFAWPAFWWLDYYAEFHRYLRVHFRCIAENDSLVVFDVSTLHAESEHA